MPSNLSVLEITERLIAMPTHNPGGDEPALAQYLATELRELRADAVDCQTFEIDGRRRAYVFARFGTPKLLVNAHIDTVPPNAGYSADPFKPRREGGRLVGLGTADTKGAIAAILAALGKSRPRDVGILFSGDEERDGNCIRAFIESPHKKGITQAIVCEPTNLKVGVRHRGIAVLEARILAEGGHSSRADALPAPIARLGGLAVAWHDWGQSRAHIGPPGYPGLCLNVASLDGGVAFNVIPSEATLTVSVRPPPGMENANMLRVLSNMAQSVAPESTLKITVDNPSFQSRAPAEFARWLGDFSKHPVDLGYWTEAAMLSQAGIDAVVFGPGDIAQAHGPDEWVEVAELERAAQAFVNVFATSAS